ncbi:hypothetical protein [Halobellus sp. GM3]|uniref:hypothetical protein n=1 Tax=Halobellus sp. GM3 TaxID=3458410 RepID=UPI00403D79F3
MALEEPAASIVRSMDGEVASSLLESVRGHSLPPALRTLVTEYQDFEAARPPFVWKWVHRLAPANTMPFVDERYRETVATTKTVLVLFITILDDLLESRRDRETFDAISSLVRSEHSLGRADEAVSRDSAAVDEAPRGSSAVDEAYVAFATRVWETLTERLRRAPAFERYAPLFQFDLTQVLTAIEYSTLAIAHPDLATLSDLRRYEVHNMGMYSYLDIDLMHTSRELTVALAGLRELIDTAQQMARIGNWLSTWEREIREGDVSSGVVVAALERGLIDPCDVSSHDGSDTADTARAIDRIKASDIEAAFLAEWNEHFWRLDALNRQLSSIDLGQFVDGTAEILRYHLASRGFK